MTDPRITRRRFNQGLAAAGALAGTGLGLLPRGAGAAGMPKQGGLFRLGLRGGNTAESLDPATYGTGMINHFMTGAVGNCLAEIDENGVAVPELAEEWTPNEDASVWTFRLRDGVTFHNGKTLEADDVIASFDYHRGPDSKSSGKALIKAVKEIRKRDRRTVEFALETGNADFPYVTAEYFFIIFPSLDGKSHWQDGVGTGGYKLVEAEPGVRYAGERYPGYWKPGRAHFDRVEALALNDTAARTNALMTGEVEAIDAVDLDTVGLMKRRKDVVIEAVTGTEHYTLPMFCDVAPFDDVDVRLALKYAIDRKQIVEKIMRGYGRVGNDSPITPANRYFNDRMEQRAYDPDKAKFHLKKAGLDRLSVTLHCSDTAFTGAVDTAVLFQASAAAAGIEIKVAQEPKDGYWSNVWLKKPFCTAFWSGRPTEDLMFTTGYAADAPWNDTHWKNERFNRLLVEARTELDEARRRQMYWEMQEIVRDDGGTIIPVYAQYVDARSTRVAHGALASNRNLDGWKSMERWWMA
ncbi:peptide/nickel transport system substrate-binding protein [Tistlia consotensis]|uniref:Peptide/nickel transport system substrate-binding protein n=1 Tax=Tistlia consotensis USBA 355 TaxID=560819 RepID=A0A1Y6CQI0_9PROT|nr:ABC transporter substrate-binding protein [Tistlia consotensis]SMF82564.1 peptide/nickel transport system substrate-binding protein [Tistlia consotensis USBA 355]SNS29301.1 peptide/nickel transport system substrate-binding protein [Tistlia consotensis]